MKTFYNLNLTKHTFKNLNNLNFPKFLINLLLLVLLVAPISSFSQKYSKGEDKVPKNKSWCFSINTGVAFANKYQANFYNGSSGNQNTINYVLGNKYWNQEIRRLVQDTFNLRELPTNMKYSPAFCVGFGIKKKFNNNFGVFGNFNFSRFKALDAFTMTIGNYPVGYSFPNIKTYAIWGKEDRTNIDLGVSMELKLVKQIYALVEVGFNINSTRVKENKIAIESATYTLIDIYANNPYTPNTNMQEYQIKEGGLGIGAFVSPGFEFRFNQNVAVQLLGSFYWTRINLMHYDAYKPQYNVMLRFVFSTSADKVI